MSTAIQPTKQTGLAVWVAQPEAHSRLQAAVGDVMSVDTFIAHMLTAFQAPEIKRCTDQSKFTALHECAALGLLPTLNQVRLIPYRNNEGSFDLKSMPQWQGYKALMERHPSILEVNGVLVHKNDSYHTENGEFIHSYDPFSESREFKTADDLVGGYCKIIYRDGRPPKYHTVTARQIIKCQGCAQTQNVWNKWYEQMALKTLYRDCYARRAVPIDPLVYARLQKALDIDDVVLGNNPMRIDSDTREVTQLPTSKAEALAQRLTHTAPTTEPEGAPENGQQTTNSTPEESTETKPAATSAAKETESATAEESATLDEWMTAIKDEESIKNLQGWIGNLPHISEAGKTKLRNRIEMRIAEIRAGRGENSNK